MKKNFVRIMIANMITLVIGVVTNFLLPKYLSFESYAHVKTYALYLTYAGFFSLGYNDGMYLKYGGKELKEVDEKSFGSNFSNYSLLILLMFIIVLTVGIILKDNVVIAFAFGVFSYNELGYLKSFYQATGEFKSYANTLNIEKILIFIFNIILIFIFKSDNSNYYIWVQVLTGIVICLYLSIKLNNRLHFIKYSKFSIIEMIENIKSGFVLMLGNFSSGVFTGIDRWFIKIFLTSVSFAKYSFAASLENIINVFTTPITISMYNYFCKKPQVEQIKKLKSISLMWGTVVIAIAYPAKFVLEHYLTKYSSVSNIIFILFATQVFNIIVKGIYVNIYKSQKKQKKYLLQMLLMLVIATSLDFIFIKLFNSMILVAIATLLTTFIWFMTCELEKNNKIRFCLNEHIYLFAVLCIYLFTGYRLSPIAGLFTYALLVLLLSLLLMNKTSIYLINTTKKIIIKRIKHNN